MENFFIGDKFHSDFDSFLSDLDFDDDAAIHALPEDWAMQAEQSNLEPVFNMNEAFVIDAINEASERYDNRLPEDSEDCFEDIAKAIRQSVDFEKLNSLLPKLYYANQTFFTITKKDLIEYIS